MAQSQERFPVRAVADRPAALKQLMDFSTARGFNLVAFLEPVRRSNAPLKKKRSRNTLDVGPVMSLVRGDRVQSLPLTNPIESWPIAAQSAASSDPFIWRPYEPSYFSMNRLAHLRQIAVRAFFRRFHVSGAITTPVHVDEQTFGFVTWFCCSKGKPPFDEWQDLLSSVATGRNRLSDGPADLACGRGVTIRS